MPIKTFFLNLIMERYSRQIVFIGMENQEKLSRSTVAVVGLGGIGSIAAEILARAGVNLIIIDRDIVEKNNLQRQNYIENDIGKPKSFALAERLRKINSDISIKSYFDDFNPFTIEMLKGADIILDGLDNLESRFILNDYSMKNNITFAYCSAIRNEGFFKLFNGSPCLRCIFDKRHTIETCESSGIVNTITNFIATIAVNEIIKYIISGKAVEEMIHVNTSKPSFDLIKIKRGKDCKACNGIYEYLDNKKESYVSMVCDNSYHISLQKKVKINIHELGSKLKNNSDITEIKESDTFLGLTYRKNKITLFNDGRMIIRNISSENEAKSLASKIIGF